MAYEYSKQDTVYSIRIQDTLHIMRIGYFNSIQVQETNTVYMFKILQTAYLYWILYTSYQNRIQYTTQSTGYFT